MYDLRPKGLQITMLSMFVIFGRVRNHEESSIQSAAELSDTGNNRTASNVRELDEKWHLAGFIVM